MGLIPDQRAIQDLVSASPIQRSAIAFMRGVRTLQSTVRIPASAITASNTAGEVRAAIADHELDPVGLSAEVHEEVAGLLRGPFPGGVLGDSEDADAQTSLLVMVTRRQWAMAAVGYGAVTVKCAVTGVAPEALTVTVAWYTPAVA
jgi:hypothetical protein